MDKLTVASALSEIPLFAALSVEDRGRLVERARLARFARSEPLFRRGDVPVHVYVILAGVVKVTLPDESGRETVISLLRDGQMLGELALFDEEPRSATVTAVTATVTAALEREDFFAVLQREPRAMRYLLKQLASTIRRLSDQIEDLVSLDLASRVAKQLLQLSTESGGAIPLSQEDLAAATGATRGSVNRVLTDLQQRGLIQVSRRRVDIVNAALLKKEVRYY